MYCEQCGAYNRDDARFCINCGHHLEKKEGSKPTPTHVMGKDTFTLIKKALKDKYEVISELGRGGMAIVFKARDLKLDRLVAIKVLPPEFAYDAEFLRRFHHEAKTAAKLEHPNIISIYEVGMAEGLTYFAMSYIDGETLGNYIKRRGSLPPEEAIRIAKEITTALSYARRKKVIHRDIKPENILLDREGRVKVTDFGIAKAAFGTTIATRSGISLGTPHYMSPEQARGRKLDHRSDLYSVGIVIYEMITGSVPFKGEDITSIMYRHVHETPEPPSKINKDIPEWLEKVVLRLLAKDPDARFQTAEELIAALSSKGKIISPVKKASAKTTRMIATEVTPPRHDKPLPKKRSPIKTAFITLMLAIAIVSLGYYLISSGKVPSIKERFNKTSSIAMIRKLNEKIEDITSQQIKEKKEKEEVKPVVPPPTEKKVEKEPALTIKKETKKPAPTPPIKEEAKKKEESTTEESEKPTAPLEITTPEPGVENIENFKKRPLRESLSPAERKMLLRMTPADRGFYLAEKVDTPQAWREFLKRFPRSPKAPYARRRLAELTKEQGWLRISAIPYAVVEINGRPAGRVPPPKDINLPPGSYRVRFIIEDYEAYEETIAINPGEKKRLHHEFPQFGMLVVNSLPQGGEVVIDGKTVGKTPLKLNKIAVGGHTVTVVLPGYITETRSATVTRFETTFLSLNLKKK